MPGHWELDLIIVWLDGSAQMPGHWELDLDERIQVAETFKQRGNDFFKVDGLRFAY